MLGFIAGHLSAPPAEAARPQAQAALITQHSYQLDRLVERQSMAYLLSFDPMLDGNPNPPCSDLSDYPPSPTGLVPVVNPLCAQGYLMDVDDHARWSGSGDLNAGESITITQPIVLDGELHLLLGYHDTRNATLVMSIPEIGWSAAVPQGGVGCWLTPEYDYETLPEIPGSNGGNGIAAHVVWMLTATKKVRGAAIDARVLNTVAGNMALCPQPVTRIG